MSETILTSPLLLSSFCNDWPCIKDWNLEILAEKLEGRKYSCRMSPKSCDRIMETECQHEEVSLGQFNSWLSGKCDNENPLAQYSRTSYAGYIDYKYMKDVFADHPEVFSQVQWGDFGLGDFDGYDSTIWIGSEGANTQGHQDSYGFNLVTQLSGRKLWILFPPDDVRYLYPTRLPFEESSVFSQVNIRKPDLKKHNLFQVSHPHIAVLHPGQTLYVPHHWWHYVESLDPSISINVWVPMDIDKRERLHEALTRCLATSLIKDLAAGKGNSLNHQWLNPTEDLYSSDVNLMMLTTSINQLLRNPLGNQSPITNCCVHETTNNIVGVSSSQDTTSSEENEIRSHNSDLCSCSFTATLGQPDSVSKDRALLGGPVEGDKHLMSFYERIRSFHVTFAHSPYGFDIKTVNSRKRKFDAKDSSRLEKFRLKKGCEVNHVSLTWETTVDKDVTPVLQQVKKLSPCSFNEYFKFLHELCTRQKCTKCDMQSSRTLSDSDWTSTIVESDDSCEFNTVGIDNELEPVYKCDDASTASDSTIVDKQKEARLAFFHNERLSIECANKSPSADSLASYLFPMPHKYTSPSLRAKDTENNRDKQISEFVRIDSDSSKFLSKSQSFSSTQTVVTENTDHFCNEKQPLCTVTDVLSSNSSVPNQTPCTVTEVRSSNLSVPNNTPCTVADYVDLCPFLFRGLSTTQTVKNTDSCCEKQPPSTVTDVLSSNTSVPKGAPVAPQVVKMNTDCYSVKQTLVTAKNEMVTKLSQSQDVPLSKKIVIVKQCKDSNDGSEPKSCTANEITNGPSPSVSECLSSTDIEESLLNSILHPSVISHISQLFQQQCRRKLDHKHT